VFLLLSKETAPLLSIPETLNNRLVFFLFGFYFYIAVLVHIGRGVASCLGIE